MIAVIQRVESARVDVEGETVGAIGAGLTAALLLTTAAGVGSARRHSSTAAH